MQGGRKSTAWILPEPLEPDQLLADIAAVFPTAGEPVPAAARTWYDSFDWRLLQRGFLLYRGDAGWNLLRRDSEETVASLKAERRDGPYFAGDFPSGRIRTLLEPILEMRCLLPLITSLTRATCLRILNSDDKTVARVFLEDHEITEHGAHIRMVRVQDVRGYARSFRKLTDYFRDRGISEKADIFSPFTRGVEAIGRRPFDYSSKFAVTLGPKEPARSAMITVYRQLQDVMQRNEAGILDDLDSEFLHDFRVAVRRTRSGLTQVREVLPRNRTDRAKKDFSWLGSITGPTRDLDVYLLNEEKYRARLPEVLQKGLDIFFAGVRDRRAEEHRKLVQHMHSRKYGRILAGWHDYLHSGAPAEETANAGRPVIDLAGEIISRKYGKIMKKGAAITLSSPDEHLHRVRIECKKLRYILEFFSSLFPPEEMKKVIKLLKGLQNNLGDFNDLSVQQNMLRRYLGGLRPGSRKNHDLAAALGGLLTTLYHEQQKVRREFHTRFNAFSADGSARLYAKLFARRTRSGTNGGTGKTR